MSLVLSKKIKSFFIVLYCSPNDPKTAYKELIHNCLIFYTTEVSQHSLLVYTAVAGKNQYLIRMTPTY